MSKIPAASIDGVDLRKIRARFPLECAEIARLGHLLAVGAESSRDLINLAKLLNEVGEAKQAEEMLRDNVVGEGGLIHRAYGKLFGQAVNKDFAVAIRKFSTDFTVVLAQKHKLGFLRAEYRSRPKPRQRILNPTIARFLASPATVEFKFEATGTTADICSDRPEMRQEYIILKLLRNKWSKIGGSK